MLDRLVKLNPVRPGEDAVISQFAGIGVGPCKVQLAAKPDAATIARTEVDAMKAIDAAGPRIGTMTNDWLVNLHLSRLLKRVPNHEAYRNAN